MDKTDLQNQHSVTWETYDISCSFTASSVDYKFAGMNSASDPVYWELDLGIWDSSLQVLMFSEPFFYCGGLRF